MGICPGPGCCCRSSPPRSCCGQTWDAKGVAVGDHIMCSAISPSVPACQDGWSGCRPQQTLSPDPADALFPDPGAKLRPPLSTSGARGPQLNLLSSMYVGAGLINPRARGQGVDSEGGSLLPFPLAPCPFLLAPTKDNFSPRWCQAGPPTNA